MNICTTCKQEKDDLEFINIITKKETKTCQNCRDYKRKYAAINKTTEINDISLTNHYDDLRQNTSKCDDCDMYFLKKFRKHQVNIYNISDDLPDWSEAVNQYFARIRSIQRREELLKQGVFIKICYDCKLKRLNKHRNEMKIKRKIDKKKNLKKQLFNKC